MKPTRWLLIAGVVLVSQAILVMVAAAYMSINVKHLSQVISDVKNTVNETPPNIILIVSDDQTYLHYGFMGDERLLAFDGTLQMDTLVEGGVLFPLAHNSAAFCVPSIETMLSGRYPKDFKIGNSGRTDADGVTITTIPLELSRAGYVSFGGGKFWDGALKPDFTAWCDSCDNVGRYPGSLQPFYDFIDSHPGEPFFIWLAPRLPHQPLNAPYEFHAPQAVMNQFPNVEKEMWDYYANIKRLDAMIAELVQGLKDRGLYESTLLLYVSDNGWLYEDENNRVWHNAKHNFSENGYRSVLWAHLPGPGGVVSGLRRSEMAHTVDILPTILDYAGLWEGMDPQEKLQQKLEGRSLKPLLEGQEAYFEEDFAPGNTPQGKVPWRKYLFGLYNKNMNTSRIPVKWRSLLAPNGIKYYPEGRAKQGEYSPALFDLIEDPNETNNLLDPRNAGYDPNDPRIAPAILDEYDRALDGWAPVE